ncbi:MAG: hypothetical protein KDD06_10650 [Phaeodactylibacter sp.]|nr:hypothetical protein [Phaeodactylibacter sp.]MCB9266715.1 hypothetical protein [Lewinellaceae bacterium]MCB9289026.1 hypothetical protein [Lewinellaceae bacterium]
MAKKTNPIDRIIKEKLEGLEVPFDAASWQLMEQKLDDEAMGMAGEGQPVADTKHFDEAVFEKLHNYKAGYQPGHWQRMEALLEEVFAWPRQVLRYKAMELALMLLLFLFLWQYIPTRPTGTDPAPQARKAAPSAPSSGHDTDPETAPAPQRHGQTPQAALSEGHSKPRPESSGPAIQGISSSARTPAAGDGKGIGRDGNSTASEKDETTFNENYRATPAEQQPSRLFLPLTAMARPIPLLSIPAYALPEASPLYPRPMALLDWLDALPAEELAYEGLRDIGEASFIKNNNRPTFRVGMFGSAEYNHITVPSSEEKKLEEELQRYAMGYGGGLSFGFEFGRFEIETGAIYAARQYPVGLVYVNGSVGSGLQGQRLEASELNIINVPLHFRYSFLRRGSWRAYALAGASLQVAFQRNYYVSEEPQYDFRPMQPPPAPAPDAGEEPVIDRIRKSGLGWFEGGTFEENAYLTGNVGIGLERYIGSRWSLFVQPTYQHSLQYFRVGLGPNADRINSLSFLFGAKVRVK